MTQKLSDIDPMMPGAILLKSPWGLGKTVAALSFAREMYVYLAYFDKKAPTGAFHFLKKNAPELLNRIDFDVFGANNAHEYINKLIDFQKNGTKYGCIVTDSVTTMTASAVNWSMSFKTNSAKKDPSKDLRDKNTPLFIPDFDDYKTETNYVSQAIDICKMLPCWSIWTAHPMSKMKMDMVPGQENRIKSISKVNSIVTYGQRVADMIPGSFQEIYHFSSEMEYTPTSNRKVYKVCTNMVGDDFAKTEMNLPSNFDITDKLFYDVWKELVKKGASGG